MKTSAKVLAAAIALAAAASAQATQIQTQKTGCGGGNNGYCWQESITSFDGQATTRVNASNPFSYTFDLAPEFQVGVDDISTFDLTFSLLDDAMFDGSEAGAVDLAAIGGTVYNLNLSGLSSLWESSYTLSNKVEGLAQLDSSGKLSFKLSATSGDYLLSAVSLKACGTNNTPSVPEPASLGLAALGLMGLRAARRVAKQA